MRRLGQYSLELLPNGRWTVFDYGSKLRWTFAREVDARAFLRKRGVR